MFNFNERAVFGRFDLLIRRLNKLKSLFETVQQFKLLSEQQVEGMEVQIAAFFRLVQEFRQLRHDLLAFENNDFDRSFLEFNARVLVLESELQVTVLMVTDRGASVVPCVRGCVCLIWSWGQCHLVDVAVFIIVRSVPAPILSRHSLMSRSTASRPSLVRCRC